MDESSKYRVPIGDACVSMRVCFDSLCFSSTQQRLADEEDAAAAAAAVAAAAAAAGAAAAAAAGAAAAAAAAAAAPTAAASQPQLPAHGTATVVAAAVTTAVTATTSNNSAQVTRVPQIGTGVSAAAIATGMGTLRELQELLRVKDERIGELEMILRNREAEIQELRSHLDKFLSVLPFKPPLTPTKPRPRKQRAQGISAEPPLQELAPLAVIDKSDRHSAYPTTVRVVGPSSSGRLSREIALFQFLHCSREQWILLLSEEQKQSRAFVNVDQRTISEEDK
ncbi:hypothetical protein HN011_011965 [Eciton burchellii]|nr:hypothetical protein HN011_011965 [Eciton burchellii]